MGRMKDVNERYRNGEGKRSDSPDEFLAEVARETSLWDSGLWALPAVRSYLKRIGAEPIGLRKARITEWDSENYKEYEVTIGFFPDSSEKEQFIEVTCKGDKIGHEAEYEPFPDELSAIYNARDAIEWPNPTYVSLDDARSILDGVIGSVENWPKGNLKDNIGFPKFAVGSYVNLGDITDTDNTDPVTITPVITKNGLAALELRKDFSDGGKLCQVFQPYDDGMWYVESGQLPLVGLPPLLAQRGPVDVVLVEGPKDQRAALKVAFPDLYCKNDREKQAALDNPWSNFLNGKVVLSYLKGAGGVRVTDWSVLSGRNVRSLTIICDNDDSGRKAAYRVSEALCKANFPIGAILHYPSGFPDKWGFADGFFSVEDYEERQRKNGARLSTGADWRLPETMVVDVTWLTYDYWGKDNKGNDVLKYGIRSGKPESWVYINNQDAFTDARKAKGKMVKAENLERRFNNRKHYGAMGLKVQGQITSKPEKTFDDVTFEPENYEKVVAGKGGDKLLNRWQPLSFDPIEPEPWEMRFFNRFTVAAIPDKFERLLYRRGLATNIAHPARKGHAYFLNSVKQGSGKSFGMEVLLKTLVNPEHYLAMNGSKLNGQFNSIIAGITSLFADESSDRDTHFYNDIKTLLSEETVLTERKFQDKEIQNNYITVWIASNRNKSVFLELSDRRVLVIFFRESEIPKKIINDLVRWLRNENGYNKLLWWARNYEGNYSDGRPVEPSIKPETVPKENFIGGNRDNECRFPLKPTYVRDKENAPITYARQELIRNQVGKAVGDMLALLEEQMDDEKKGDVFYLSFDAFYEAYELNGKYKDKLPNKDDTLKQMARAGFWHIPMKRGGEGDKGKRSKLDLYRPEKQYDPEFVDMALSDDEKRKRSKRMIPLFSPAAAELMVKKGGCRVMDEKSCTMIPRNEQVGKAVKLLHEHQKQSGDGCRVMRKVDPSV